MIPAYTARPAGTGVFQLGEGPVWDPGRQRLLWVDIDGHAVHEGTLDVAGGLITETGIRRFAAEVGAVAVAASGELIVAERETLTRVAPDGTRTELARVLPRGTPSRLNDGAVDPAGRFLVGSLGPGREVLVRLDPGGLTTLDADLRLSNGLAWSPAGDRMYSIDTVPGTIWARDYDAVTGATGERREAFRVTDGSPDGMCADVEGNLWIAVWGGGRVERRTPDGRLLATVTVGAPHTTSAAFAGPDLDVLVITTAVDGPAEPDGAGRLFTARVDTTGLPVPYWAPGR
ncbi:SMP-30/gluconolactonase/LRE family protein [Catenuloplanes atrovinosus]|uniref:Sugar lactone lactonase YvrE n=1 Tax=Catenuloplanes atrovinosus TaxID=137266 RepID=A0AAE3YRD2_9ACTN|nr:SMP-30/gluconolactonase/LRE family protein [Catenuloplanes atrovinosus]MDR7276939.1 sugar lactone lactonase YvrE [Catenuloplanes atrovinosus]